MEKLDTYKTLTNLVGAFRSEETATKTPFIFVIQTPDGEGYNFVGCNTTHNLGNLVHVILVQFVDSMKNAVKDGVNADKVVTEMLSDMCKTALLECFIREINNKISDTPEESFEEPA